MGPINETIILPHLVCIVNCLVAYMERYVHLHVRGAISCWSLQEACTG